MPITFQDVTGAAGRIAARTRPVAMLPAAGPGRWYAAEFLQHTGTFKARGAANLLAAHRTAGTLPEAGVTIASGGNAGLACAWAAAHYDVPATVFVPGTAPLAKVARLHRLGAHVVQVGSEYAHAAEAATEHVQATGALASHAYDDPFIAAGAGTLMQEILTAAPGGVDTVVVAVGGGGLLAGVATVAAAHDVRVVAVEPTGCSAFSAALAQGAPCDVAVDSVAADSLGARRVTQLALDAARLADVRPVLVSDESIVAARRRLWEEHRLVVEHAAAAAQAALDEGHYVPAADERVVTILCGANTDPSNLQPAAGDGSGR